MTPGAAGMDLHAAVTGDVVIAPGAIALIPTGLQIAIPEGFEGQVRPQSGLAVKRGISLPNTPATIDSDYRGEICVPLVNLRREAFRVSQRMRIAQLVVAAVVRVGGDRAAAGHSPRGEWVWALRRLIYFRAVLARYAAGKRILYSLSHRAA